MGDTIKFWKGVMRRRNEAKKRRDEAESQRKEADKRRKTAESRRKAAAKQRNQRPAVPSYMGVSERRHAAMRDAMKDD